MKASHSSIKLENIIEYFFKVSNDKQLGSCKKLHYSKAFRCTFFGEWEHWCSSKFVQLELLDRAKAKTSKKTVQLKVFTT